MDHVHAMDVLMQRAEPSRGNVSDAERCPAEIPECIAAAAPVS
jgi:hypothetical protein